MAKVTKVIGIAITFSYPMCEQMLAQVTVLTAEMIGYYLAAKIK
jgi:hypothetical protein